MSEWNRWYVRVGDATVGPVSTELLVKGIEHRKVPPEALVCAVGGSTWMSLGTIQVFHSAVVRSYPPPPPGSEEERYWLGKGFRFPRPAPLGVSLADDAPPRVDWTKGFQGFFLEGCAVDLPDEDALLESLAAAPRSIFEHDEPLWNLALCIAYGSDVVSDAAGRAFFESVEELGTFHRLAWMGRTLSSAGFVPSGIAPEAGRRGFDRLRALCPPGLALAPEHPKA